MVAIRRIRETPTADPSLDRVLRARAGDAAAFTELVQEHERAVHNLVLNIVRNVDDAGDVAQEVWLRVARKLPQLNAPERFPAWLYRIARNCALDQYNARKTRPAAAVRDDDAGDPFDVVDLSPDGPEQHVMSLDERRKVWEALGGLAEADRTVLFLREFEELPYAEIARTLGISCNAAEVRVFRARERFRKQFKLVDQAPHACNVSSLQLSAFVDRELGSAARTMLERHTDECADCTRRLNAIASGRALYRGLGLFPAPAGLMASILAQTEALLSSVAAATVAATATGTAVVTTSAVAASAMPLGALGTGLVWSIVGGATAKVAAVAIAATLAVGVAAHPGPSGAAALLGAPLPIAPPPVIAPAALHLPIGTGPALAIAPAAPGSVNSADPVPPPAVALSDLTTSGVTPSIATAAGISTASASAAPASYEAAAPGARVITDGSEASGTKGREQAPGQAKLGDLTRDERGNSLNAHALNAGRTANRGDGNTEQGQGKVNRGHERQETGSAHASGSVVGLSVAAEHGAGNGNERGSLGLGNSGGNAPGAANATSNASPASTNGDAQANSREHGAASSAAGNAGGQNAQGPGNSGGHSPGAVSAAANASPASTNGDAQANGRDHGATSSAAGNAAGQSAHGFGNSGGNDPNTASAASNTSPASTNGGAQAQANSGEHGAGSTAGNAGGPDSLGSSNSSVQAHGNISGAGMPSQGHGHANR